MENSQAQVLNQSVNHLLNQFMHMNNLNESIHQNKSALPKLFDGENTFLLTWL